MKNSSCSQTLVRTEMNMYTYEKLLSDSQDGRSKLMLTTITMLIFQKHKQHVTSLSKLSVG